MQLRCEDWTTVACVEGGVDPASGGGSGPDASEFLSPTGATPDQIADAITISSDVLFGLTGRLFTGACGPRTVRPCSRYPNGNPAWPALRFAAWQRNDFLSSWAWNPTWGECGCNNNPCSCVRIDRISIGVYPILDATVKIDGEAVAEHDVWELVEHRWFDRVDGGVWPLCNNPDLPDSDVDTFSITVHHGIEVPEGGAAASCFYARQIALGMAGEPCELPSRVSAIIRQGVSMQFHDPTDLIKNGLTGIDLVDQWVQSITGGVKVPAPSTFIIPGVQHNRGQLGNVEP